MGTLTEDAYFDPEVEFEEVGVGINGRRTWEVVGPDLDGAYGSFQGVGGLEATVRESDGGTTPVLNDYFGNVGRCLNLYLWPTIRSASESGSH